MRIVVRGSAEVIGLVLGLVSTVWVSRAVGPTFFGYYAVTLTITTLATTGINAGLSSAGSQWVANEPERAGAIWWEVLVGRIVIAVPAIGVGLILLTFLPMASVLHDFLLIGLLLLALLPFRTEWLLIAEGRLQALSAIRVLASVASLLFAVMFIRGPSDAGRLPFVAVAFAAASAVVSMLAAARTTSLRWPRNPGPRGVLRAHILGGLHYLKNDASVFIFTSSDRLFLYAFATPAIVGLYDAAYRVIQPFYMIFSVVGDAMYRSLAEAYGTDRLKETFRRYVDLMCFATIPLGFFLLAFSPAVIDILYGTKFAGSSEFLKILGWVITVAYTSGVAVVPFAAWNRPREYGNSSFIGGGVNLALNFTLIPAYNGYGAAWATVAANVVVTLVGVRYFRQATDYPLVFDLIQYLVVSFAALAIAVVTAWVLPYSAFLGIVVFGLAYVVLVGIVRWRHYGQIARQVLRAFRSRAAAIHGDG